MIKIKLDYNGNPYIEISCDEHVGNHEDQITTLFIRKARDKGLVVKNESSFETSNSYISIRLKGTKE